MASAAVWTALSALDVVGFRKDSLSPEVIAATAMRREEEQAIALIRGMTLEQILEMEVEELAAEKRARDAARRGNTGKGSIAIPPESAYANPTD